MVLCDKEKEELKRRIGKFYIYDRLYDNEPQEMFKILEGMIVLDCRYNYGRQAFEYTAVSLKFSVLSVEQDAPLYKHIVDRKGNILWDTVS